MKSYQIIFFLTILALLSPTKSTNTLSQSFTCLNPANANFFKVCNLVFFPPSLNITANITLAASHDLLLEATLPTLNVSTLVSQYLSSSLQSLAHAVHLDNFALSNLLVEINLGNTTQALRFSGTLTLFSQTGLQVDVLVMAKTPPSLFLGLSLPFNTIEEVLNSFFPMDVDAITSVFNGTSSLSLALTNGFDFSVIPELEPSYLQQIDSWDSPAVTLYANIGLTSGSNAISRFLAKYLGPNAALLLVMSVTNTTFNGYAGIANIQITSNMTLKTAGVGLKIGFTTPAPEFSIQASLQLTVSDYALVFNGKATFTPLDLSLQFSMDGVWVNAFGLQRLSFGNLLLGGGISYAGVPSTFSIGAEIAIGLNCFNGSTFQGNGYCLDGKGFVGIDIVKPENNYYYLQVSALSLDVLLRALLGSQTQQTVVIPPILNNALQFPNGILASFSLTDQTLPGTTITAGYVFQGTVSIFGASATVNVAYYINQYAIQALIYSTPFVLGNVFSLVGNSSTNGPYFNMDVGIFPVPTFNVQLYANLTFLGISSSVQIYIGIDKLSFNISGPILYGLLLGDFDIEITNNNFQGGSFSVSANLQMNQAMLDLVSFVSNAAATALNSAKAKVTQGQTNVLQAQGNLDTNKNSICANISAKCGSLKCTASHQQCSAYKQNQVCVQTGQKCSGGWISTCISTAKSCASYLPGWLSWMCSAWQTICTGTSQVCQGWESFCSVSTTVIDYTECITENTICDIDDWIIDTACQTACDDVQIAYNTAEAALTAASDVLQGVENTLGSLANAFDFISKEATILFNILNAGFSIVMNAGNMNQFNLGITVTFDVIILGTQYQRSIEINFSDYESIKEAVLDDVLTVIKTDF